MTTSAYDIHTQIAMLSARINDWHDLADQAWQEEAHAERLRCDAADRGDVIHAVYRKGMSVVNGARWAEALGMVGNLRQARRTLLAMLEGK